MKHIQMTDCTVEEAMAQIDALKGLNVKNKGCLRLLTEEMFSMVNELLKASALNYEINITDNKYALRVSVEKRVSEDARAHFMSISSDGVNVANKGLRGMLGAIMESLLYSDDTVGHMPTWMYGMESMSNDYAHIWSLSQYMNDVPPEKASEDWDGMEKSIIANFADDVSIGVRSGRLEMTVTKLFA